MSAIDSMNYLNASLEVFAALTVGILLLGCLLEHRHATRADRVFVAALIVQFFTLLTDALSWVLLVPPARGSAPLLQALYCVNYSLGCGLIALYAYYVVLIISERKPVSLWYARGVAIGCAVASLSWVISVFNGMYIYFDDRLNDVPGSLYWLSQIFLIALPFSIMVIIIKFRKTLGRKESLVMISYGVMPVATIVTQLFGWTTPLLLATTLSVILVYIVIHVERAKRAAEQEKRLAQQELELSHAQVSIMLSQIQPHFLYNALTTIKHLCATGDSRAEGVVADFAKYLRGNMDSLTDKAPIPFDRELNHLECYLAIERLRFPKVKIVYDILTSDFNLPALTVQPLVENAIRYGVTRRENGGTVTISTWEDAASWYVRIADDGVGFDPMHRQYDGRSHIGITNTRERLESMCGGTLTIKSEKDVGTAVTITLPKEREYERTVRR